MRQHKVFLRHELLKYNSEKSTAKSSALENYISSANLSLSGCSSAEPNSVSVGRCKFQLKKLYLQTVKKVDHLPIKQLKYINTLMSLDKNYEKNYKYLFSKINKEYDTHKLINEKNKIESSLKNQRTIISSILLLTILASLFYWNRYNSLQKKYKEKFEEIISQKPILEKSESQAQIELKEGKQDQKTLKINDKIKITAPKNSSELEFYNKIPGLNPILVQNILQQLDKFEEELRFTDNQMSLRLLSEEFNTNIPYLSKIINVYKGKNFNYYINDLRIDYIIELLKNDATYLNYDIKNLASLAGFTNAVNFSDNFQRKFEIKPSYFIKMMKENIKTHS